MNLSLATSWRAYALSLLTTLAALLLTLVLEPWLSQSLFLFFTLAVVLSAWYGGLAPGLLAGALSALATAYFFLNPHGSLAVSSLDELLQLIAFVCVAVIISSLTNARKVVEQSLRESKAQLEIILRGITDGILVHDADQRLVYANDAAAQILNIPSTSTLVTQSAADVLRSFAIADEAGAPLAPAQLPHNRALHGEAVREQLVRLSPQPHGDERWALLSATPTFDAERHVQLVVNIVHDVTAQHHTARRLSAQYATARILADAATLGDAAPKVLQTICETCDWQAGLLWRVERESDTLRCVDGWHAPALDAASLVASSRAQTLAQGADLPGRVWASAQPVWLADLTADTDFPRLSSAQRDGLRTAIGFPIRLAREVLGVVELFSATQRAPDSDLLALLATLGSQIGQFMDRMRAESELREAELRYRTLVEQVPAITYITSLDEPQGLTYISPQHEALLGYPSDAWLRDAAMRQNAVHPDDRARVLAAHAQSLATGEPFRCEYRLFAHDGRELWMHDEAIIVRNTQGKPRYLQGIVFDITSRRHAEETLRQSEQRIRTIWESAHEAMALSDPDGNVLMANPAYYQMYGYTPEQVIGKPFNLIFAPHERESAMREYHAVFQSASITPSFETRVQRADGTTLTVEASYNFLMEQGERTAMLSVVHDVSERTRAEQELRQAVETRDRALAETHLLNEIAVAVSGEQNLGRMLSTALLQLSEVIPFTGGSIALVEEDELVIRAAYGAFATVALGTRLQNRTSRSWQVVESREPMLLNDLAVTDARPTTPIRSWLSVPLTWRGETLGLLEIDSTEPNVFRQNDVQLMQKVATLLSGSIALAQRYAAELHALAFAENTQWKLETVLKQMPSGVAVADYPSGKITLGNEQYERIVGQAMPVVEGIADDNQTRAFHADGTPLAPQDLPLARAIRLGETVRGEEVNFVRGDGSHATMRINAAPIRNRRGDMISAVAVFDDVTESKQREQALHRTNSILNAVFEGTIDAVFVKDLDGRYLTINSAGARMLGHTPAEIVGKTDAELFSADSAARIAEHDRLVLLSGETITYEESATAAGVSRTYLSTKGPYRDAQGTLLGLIGISRDISERKRTEEHLRFLVEASHILGSSLDYETTLQRMAELAVPSIADWCVVDILQDDGSLKPVAVAHGDPAQRQMLRELARRYPRDRAWTRGAMNVLRTGKAEVFSAISDELLVHIAQDAEHLRLLRSVAPKSLVSVPLVADDKTIGVLTFYSSDVRRLYSAADLRLAEALAGRAALAVENARLYRQAQQANERLEQRVTERTAELAATNQNLEVEIAERRQAEERIARSEYLLAQAQQLAHLGSWQWQIESNVVTWSDELYRIYGLQPGEVAINYESFVERVHPDDRMLVNEAISTAFRERTPFSFDHRIVRPDGSIRTLYARGELISDAAGNPLRMVGTGQDISERKRIEDALRQSHAEARRLSRHLQTAREEERTRIAREIHDQLGQVLTAVKMDLTLLGRKFSDGQPPQPSSVVLTEIRNMSQLVDNTIQSVREIITELRPEMLEDLGLRASIEWQVQEFETRTGIVADFTTSVRNLDLDLERATAAFRILQEALTNIVRHANATQVEVRLRRQDDQLILEVQDNGRGIGASEMTKAKSFGILGMRERALIFGGEVSITGQAGRGTTVRVTIPLGETPHTQGDAGRG